MVTLYGFGMFLVIFLSTSAIEAYRFTLVCPFVRLFGGDSNQILITFAQSYILMSLKNVSRRFLKKILIFENLAKNGQFLPNLAKKKVFGNLVKNLRQLL